MFEPVWIVVGLSIILNALLGYEVIRLDRENADLRRANQIRKDMIDEARAGDPPFVLDPGVSFPDGPKD